jgi:hypothetical protein
MTNVTLIRAKTKTKMPHILFFFYDSLFIFWHSLETSGVGSVWDFSQVCVERGSFRFREEEEVRVDLVIEQHLRFPKLFASSVGSGGGMKIAIKLTILHQRVVCRGVGLRATNEN